MPGALGLNGTQCQTVAPVVCDTRFQPAAAHRVHNCSGSPMTPLLPEQAGTTATAARAAMVLPQEALLCVDLGLTSSPQLDVVGVCASRGTTTTPHFSFSLVA
jgi:hypothetical protein